jgi:hypothetical protein
MNGISLEQMNFLVFLVELASDRLFSGNKQAAYRGLKNVGLLDFYAKTYDTPHTLGSEYLLAEISNQLKARQ